VRVAILGATGHVGRVLTAGLGAREEIELVLVARNPERASAFAALHVARASWRAVALEHLPSVRADAFVNCLGAGDPGRLPHDVLELETTFNALLQDALRHNDGARGIAFSSGVVYDSDFTTPADENTPLRATDSAVATIGDAYALGKARSEAAHRAKPELPIVDLRLFSLYSRFVDRSARYLMNDIVDAIETGNRVTVSPEEITRDYVAPLDLTALVGCVLEAPPLNLALDVYSAEPVSKRELLDYLGVRYGLAYTDVDGEATSPTGAKPNYYSTYHDAGKLGYTPSRTSLECLSEEIDALLELREGGDM